MTNEIKLTVRPFQMGTEKEAAKKLPEEAAEAFAEWHDVYLCSVGTDEKNPCATCEVSNYCQYGTRFADEIADTIQACCNLADRYNIDLQSAMQRCEQKNRTRGRHPIEVKNAEPSGVRDSHDCNRGGNCGAASTGTGVLREKSPEEMNVEELIEALSFASDNRIAGCGDGICEEWCDRYPTCSDCRQKLLDLLEKAYKQEKEGLRCEESYLADEIVKRDKEIEGLKKEIADLTHERDGLRNRLAEPEQRIARLEKSNDWLTSRCGQLEERVFELGKQVYRAAIIEKGLRNRGMHDMAEEFADFHDVTEDAYAAFLALLKVDDGE